MNLTNRLSHEEYQRVLSFFERAVNDEPERWTYWCDIGFCRGKLGQWQEAANALERVADKPEAAGSVLSMLGHAYIQLERYEEAEEVLKRALITAPNDMTLLYKMAIAYFHRGEMKRALPLLVKIVARKPNHAKAQFGIGLIAHLSQDQKTAGHQLSILNNLDLNLAERLSKTIRNENPPKGPV